MRFAGILPSPFAARSAVAASAGTPRLGTSQERSSQAPASLTNWEHARNISLQAERAVSGGDMPDIGPVRDIDAKKGGAARQQDRGKELQNAPTTTTITDLPARGDVRGYEFNKPIEGGFGNVARLDGQAPIARPSHAQSRNRGAQAGLRPRRAGLPGPPLDWSSRCLSHYLTSAHLAYLIDRYQAKPEALDARC